MKKNLSLLTSSLTSNLRLWRGTWSDLPAAAPKKLLVLFDREDDAQCRLVRETLTNMALEAMVYPCPLGGTRFTAQRQKLAPEARGVPVLHDPNTDLTFEGAQAIIGYLFQQYMQSEVPATLAPSLLNLASARVAGLLREPFGIAARRSTKPRKPLTLYSFESSPFARPVRERLCALELPYHLINLGKQQWSEMGPATMRFALGPYRPLPGSKRAAFLEEHGRVQIPFLIDSNQDVKMFESDAILDYLERTYAKTA